MARARWNISLENVILLALAASGAYWLWRDAPATQNLRGILQVLEDTPGVRGFLARLLLCRLCTTFHLSWSLLGVHLLVSSLTADSLAWSLPGALREACRGLLLLLAVFSLAYLLGSLVRED